MSEPSPSPSPTPTPEAFDDPGLDEYVKTNWRSVRTERGWTWTRLAQEFARMPGSARLERWAAGCARAEQVTRAQPPTGRTRKPVEST